RRTVGPRRDRERSPVRFGNASSDVEPQSEVPLLRRVEGGECFRRVVDAGSAIDDLEEVAVLSRLTLDVDGRSRRAAFDGVLDEAAQRDGHRREVDADLTVVGAHFEWDGARLYATRFDRVLDAGARRHE